MPPRGLVLMSASARLRQEELSAPWMVHVSACCQDSSYFSTNKAWMSTDWWKYTDALQVLMYKWMHTCQNVCIWHVFFSLCVQIWLCQNLVKFNSQFVKLLMGPQRQTCLFQIKRILGFCCRYSAEILICVTQRKGIYAFRLTFPLCLQRLLQCCRDDSLNVTVPMRMLEIFSSEKTYHLVVPDSSLVTSLLEQILHYMVPKGNVSVICPVFVSVFVSAFKNALLW